VNTYTNLSAANAADADRFLLSVDMKVGAYVLDQTTIGTQGARHVTVTRTVVEAADTPGTIVLVGRDLSGQTISETVAVGGDGIAVPTVKWFASLISATGVGWVTAGAADTITIGYGADILVLGGVGRLHAIVVNTTAAATIVLADAKGTIATLKASIAEGTYVYDVDVSDLTADLNGASDVTIIHGPSLPQAYALT
jgi:hypothetical protein